MNNGYVMLHRSMNDNELWLLEPFTKAQAWIDIFMNANWKDGSFSVRGNILEIKRGQLGWSELTMASRWKWSRDKVRRFLSTLERLGNIRQQKTHLTTIITICNYDLFQDSNTVDDTANDTTEKQQKDSRKTTDDTQYNKVNKEKKEKKEQDLPDFINRESWDGFVLMRKKIKAPMTDRAKSLAIKKLSDFYHNGEDQNAILDQSVMNSWKGLFSVKENPAKKNIPITFQAQKLKNTGNAMAGFLASKGIGNKQKEIDI